MATSNFASTIIIGLLAGIIGAALVVSGAIPGIAPQSPTGSVRISTSNDDTAVVGSDVTSEYEEQVITTVERATPAVVSIILTRDVQVIERYYEEVPSPFGTFPDFFGDPFGPFSFRVPRYREGGTETQEIGGGSGFLVSSDGLIVTNRHVVSQENVEYTVFTSEGEKYEAQVIARDPVNDIAVMKIDGQNLPYLTFGDSDQLRVGQTVIAIGNALSEFQNTVSRGVVSGLSRSIIAGGATGGLEELEEVIQTDAAINPGNSGGPLIDLGGRVVGVNVAVALGSENIGFALPSNVVQKVVESVQETGRIVRPYLGVRYMPVTPLVQERNNLSVDYGVLVMRGETPEELAVVPGSPAAKAGIQEGDIILEIDEQRLDEETSLGSVIRKKNVGDTVTLRVLRNGEEQTVRATLEEAPA